MAQQQTGIVEMLQHVGTEGVGGVEIEAFRRAEACPTSQQIALQEARGGHAARGYVDSGAAQFQAEELRAGRLREELFGELARAAADLQHAHGSALPIHATANTE